MIPLIKSTFHNEKATKDALCKFIKKSEKLSIGEECKKFEHNFAKYQGRKHCVLVNSGSSANLALIQALINLGKIKKGDSVGFSAITWSTNVMPLIQLGLNAVPVDVELYTLNVSSFKLKDLLKKHKISMLFLTNLLGFCDDIDEIKFICKRERIILVEDNCESLGTVYRGTKLCNFGLASTFSFLGYNLRTTEINGFIGNLQIKYLNEIIEKRKNNFFKMALPIYSIAKKYYPIKHNHIDLLSNFAIPIVCRTKEIRNELVEKCKDKIEIRPIVGGDMVMQPFFRKYIPNADNFINPNAKLIHEQGLYFGNNPELTEEEMQMIIKIFTT